MDKRGREQKQKAVVAAALGTASVEAKAASTGWSVDGYRCTCGRTYPVTVRRMRCSCGLEISPACCPRGLPPLEEVNVSRKKQPVQLPPIRFPTWDVRGSPTPAERLMICDACRKASWYAHGWPPVITCHGPHEDGKNRRMREATEAEYAEGRAALKTVIGRNPNSDLKGE